MSIDTTTASSKSRGQMGICADDPVIEPVPFTLPEAANTVCDTLDDLLLSFVTSVPVSEELTQQQQATARAPYHDDLEQLEGDTTALNPSASSSTIRKSPTAKKKRSCAPTSKSPDLEQPALVSKADARKLKNRLSAAKSRQRAQEKIHSLEATLAALQRHHAYLLQEVQRLSRTQPTAICALGSPLEMNI